MKKSVILSLLLCGAALLCVTLCAVSCGKGKEPDMYVADLKVNNLASALGVDTTPVFRWQNHMKGYAHSQSAYQIVVAASEEKAEAHEGDVWDSGRVESGQNYDILYGGPALAPKSDYYFAVQVWDESGKSAWSDVSRFGTGIFTNGGWSAEWIGMTDGDAVPRDIDLEGAYWIWLKATAASSSAGTICFRRHFTVDASKEVDEVLLATAMDDYGYLFLNTAGIFEGDAKKTGWKTGRVVNLTPYVGKGDNVLGARVTNTGSSGGFLAKIEVRYKDGSVTTVVTDRAWKCSGEPGATSGWERPGYNDTAWSAPDQAVAYGGAPWNRNVVLPETVRVNVGAGAPMLRKTFEISKEVKRARLYISGLGLYELRVNGKLPDDTVLNPAHTQYEDTVHYRVYDVTELLTQGKNALAAELGNYYYNCDFYTWMNWASAAYRDEPKLLLELQIDCADGTSETVVSDESWKTYEYGPVTCNNIYKGEHYDARREVPGWTDADFDDSGWKNAVSAAAPAGELVFENMEPVRRLESFRPEVRDKGNGTYLIRNPVMTAGWARIRFCAPRGTEITITYGEKLDDTGFVVPTVNGYPLQVDRFITSGGEDFYEPRYSYKGYEYIQIDGYGGELTDQDATCYLIATDAARVSEFETGDSRINQMNEMMLRTLRNNMQGKLTDTPVYEKNGWTGDLNFAVESLNFHFDLSGLLPKILRDMGDTASSKGVVNQIAPSASSGGNSIPIWSSIFISGYYENYRTNGDLTAVRKNYDRIRLQTLDYIRTIGQNGWVWHTASYADWVSPNPSGLYTSGKTTHAPEGAGIIGTAFVYRTLSQMAEFADLLGKPEDAAEYRAAMEKIYAAFNEKFYDKEKGYYDTGYWNDTYDAGRTKYRQTSNIVPLMFGLCPPEYERSVAESVVRDIRAKDCHLDVGAVGTKYILPMLSRYGYGDIAMKLIHQDTYPSWGYWITLGADTCWETYESNARSRDHFFLGTYTDWFCKNLAGLRDFTNGFETVVLEPEIHPGLGYVNYSLKTVRGELKSFWRFTEDGKLVWDVTVPVGTTATVRLPAPADVSAYPSVTENGDVLTVLSGEYTFVMDAGAFQTDKSLLSAAVETAKGLAAPDYTGETWEALSAALSAAEETLAEDGATQFAVCAAKDKLEAALAGLEENGLRRELAALVASAETVRAENVGPSAKEALAGLLASGKAALANGGAAEEELQSVYRALADAMKRISQNPWGNLALGRPVKASSTLENAKWSLSKLTDGDRENLGGSEVCGWTSTNLTVFDHSEAVCVDLGTVYRIDRVEVMPAGAGKGNKCLAFPRDFTISVSTDGESWTAVRREENYPTPVTRMQTFDFAAADARYVRFEGTALNSKTSDGNRFRMQLGELEVYCTGANASAAG